MTTERVFRAKRKGYIQLTTLVMIAFGSAFFPRILMLLKFPSVVNLVHLAIVPWVCIFVLLKTRISNRRQIATSKELLFALLCFLSVQIASGLWNNAGTINIFLDFLLLCEHFLLLLAIICLPLTPEKFHKLRQYIIFASFTNVVFAFVQRYVLRLHLRQGLEDNIKGVFIAQGAGHVVGASVALTFGVYYFVTAKTVPLWIRSVVLLAAFQHMLMADAKQVLLVFLVSYGLFLLTKLKSIGEVFKYASIAFVLGFVLLWCIQNVPAFSAFNTWIRPEIYGPDGEATLLKSSVFRIVPSFYESSVNWLLGLGPGHTVGRLGGWMVHEYEELLVPLGATVHPASRAVWVAVSDSWLGNQSSMFSPLFGWAGVWGDLGFLGLFTFIYVWSVVWRKICPDDISRFFVLNIVVFGLVFSQMEEPGYMLYVASLIGIQWHERRLGAALQAAEPHPLEEPQPA